MSSLFSSCFGRKAQTNTTLRKMTIFQNPNPTPKKVRPSIAFSPSSDWLFSQPPCRHPPPKLRPHPALASPTPQNTMEALALASVRKLSGQSAGLEALAARAPQPSPSDRDTGLGALFSAALAYPVQPVTVKSAGSNSKPRVRVSKRRGRRTGAGPRSSSAQFCV